MFWRRKNVKIVDWWSLITSSLINDGPVNRFGYKRDHSLRSGLLNCSHHPRWPRFPTATPNVCNLICVSLLWHHVNRLRLNQAHLDNQFPVASRSLNLPGGVVWSQQGGKKMTREEKTDEMWRLLSSPEPKIKSTFLPTLRFGIIFKWCHIYSWSSHKRKRHILWYLRCDNLTTSYGAFLFCYKSHIHLPRRADAFQHKSHI